LSIEAISIFLAFKRKTEIMQPTNQSEEKAELKYDNEFDVLSRTEVLCNVNVWTERKHVLFIRDCGCPESVFCYNNGGVSSVSVTSLCLKLNEMPYANSDIYEMADFKLKQLICLNKYNIYCQSWFKKR